MSRLFWIIIGLLGFALIALLISGDRGSILGLENENFARVVALAGWSIVIGASIFFSGMRFGDVAKQLAIWTLIILVLMSGYIFRFDLQDIASRLSGGIIPGSPISTTQDNGKKQVTLIRSPNGHFEALATVNRVKIRFLVDTGASEIVLTHRDAVAAGVDPASLSFTIPVLTANGATQSARTRIASMDIGSITRRNIIVMVARAGRMDQSLLGQSFLESLSSYEKRGDRLTLRD